MRQAATDRSPATSPPSMFRQRYGPALALMLLTLAAYAPTFNGTFLWDDDEYITTNETLKSLSGLPRIWLEPGATSQYYPLVFSTFWVEYRLWGLEPIGYHLVNTLLHGMNAILLWLMLRRLGVPGGWFAAALFAVHPVHVESVAWIQERKNVLSGLFYFAAALAYLRYVNLGDEVSGEAVAENGKRLGSRAWYAPALVLAVCAFFSKTSACTLPAALALVLWWKRSRLWARDWLALAPYFILAIACGLITVWVEKSFVGARGEEFSLSWPERFVVAGRAVWFYAGKLAWPWPLTLIYPRWEIDAGAWWQYVPLVAAVAVVILF